MDSTLITPRTEWRGSPVRRRLWDVTLRDGRRGLVRALRPEDQPRVRDLIARLSPMSLRSRFFAAIQPDVAAEQLAELSVPWARLALGMFIGPGDGGRLIGHAVYDRDEPLGESAEVAFVVDDEYQGRGVATSLLRCLAELAAEEGIARFRAVVLPQNLPMLAVFRGCGLSWEEAQAGGLIHVRLATAPTLRTPAGATTPRRSPPAVVAA